MKSTLFRFFWFLFKNGAFLKPYLKWCAPLKSLLGRTPKRHPGIARISAREERMRGKMGFSRPAYTLSPRCGTRFWVIRSRMIAMITMASPASNPIPTSTRWIPTSTW